MVNPEDGRAEKAANTGEADEGFNQEVSVHIGRSSCFLSHCWHVCLLCPRKDR